MTYISLCIYRPKVLIQSKMRTKVLLLAVLANVLVRPSRGHETGEEHEHDKDAAAAGKFSMTS